MAEHDCKCKLGELEELEVRVDRLEFGLKLLEFGMGNLQDAMQHMTEGMQMLTNLVGDVLTELGAPEGE
ncbi:MAG: hypothetical protein IJ667_03780 [Synergistaceae bacterium]|nr:hypothetical protein [Synergistaceae bacterium]